MSVRYKIDREARLLCWDMDGRISPGEVLIAIGKVGRDPDFDPTFDELIVFGPATQLNAFNTRTLKESQIKLKASYGDATVRNVRSAVVCATEHAALVTKLWRALALADDSIGLDIKIFEDIAAARAWLSDAEPRKKEMG